MRAGESPSSEGRGEAVQQATRWLREHGYADATPVPGGAESGVDVRSRNALALVRHGRAAVRRSDLQRLAGARGADRSVALYAFASSHFELPAVTYADVVGIQLFTYGDGVIRPRDRGGRVLHDRARPSPRSSVPLAWGPVMRLVPLVLAVFLAAIVLIQVLALVRGGASVSVGGIAAGLVAALGLAWLWFGLLRRSRRRAGPDPTDPDPSGGPHRPR